MDDRIRSLSDDMILKKYFPLTKEKQPEWLLRKVISCHNNDHIKKKQIALKYFCLLLREKIHKQKVLSTIGLLHGKTKMVHQSFEEIIRIKIFPCKINKNSWVEIFSLQTSL